MGKVFKLYPRKRQALCDVFEFDVDKIPEMVPVLVCGAIDMRFIVITARKEADGKFYTYWKGRQFEVKDVKAWVPMLHEDE